MFFSISFFLIISMYILVFIFNIHCILIAILFLFVFFKMFVTESRTTSTTQVKEANDDGGVITTKTTG